MPACCSWCLCFVKEPDNYDRRKQRLFCSTDCQLKDFLFRKWQSDTNLNLRMEARKREAQNKTDQGPNSQEEGET